jgi:hypothetical protein
MKKILFALLLFCSNAFADNVLLIGGNDANIRARLENAGHTVTYLANTPANLSGYNQVWDLRYNNYAMTAAEKSAYTTLLQNNGFLYFAGENSSFATRNNDIGSFVTSLGGGTITVSGSAANGQTGSNVYFSNGETATYIAAASITKTGSGRVLTADSSGKATAMMWVGNAGDFAAQYNGTVIVVADINWTQGSFFTEPNRIFLDSLINGIVEGTVQGTITSSGTGAAPPPPPPPDWKVIRTNSTPVVISNIFPTSNNSPPGEGATQAFDGNVNTKYLNFDKKNAGVTVRLSQGRVVQKFTITTANDFSGRDPTSYKLYGSNDGVNWTLIKQDSLSLSEQRFWTSPEITVANTTAYVYYFILFPTTKSGDGCGLNCDSMQIAEVTYYYDLNDGVTSTDTGSGGTPANPGQAGSVCSDCFSSNITAAQQALLDAARTRRNAISVGNRIDLNVEGPNAVVTIEQVGSFNRIQGLGGANTNAHIGGFSNTVDIKQGDTLSGRNLIELSVQGNGNVVTMSQARNTSTGAVDGQESGGHISRVSIAGDVGNYTFRQGNDGGASSGHFLNYTMQGNGGTHRVTQSNNGEKLAFISITGNNNNETINQSGTGNHFLDLTITGAGNNANITQTGSAGHKATISLINAGGPSNATLTQQGSTAQIYSITQQCANLSGCSVSVIQGTP